MFEHLDNLALLAQEIHEDLAHGLMGKTAIHPSQVNLIEQHYRVQESDVEMAMRLVNPACPTIFKMQNSMCEVATCRIPDDCIDSKRYPLFIARTVLRELIESLEPTGSVKP